MWICFQKCRADLMMSHRNIITQMAQGGNILLSVVIWAVST